MPRSKKRSKNKQRPSTPPEQPKANIAAQKLRRLVFGGAGLIGLLAVGYFSYGWLPAAVERAIPVAAGSGRGVNVLLITLDTTRADRIGCYGCTGVKTPAIDALAAGGIRFADAVSAVPMTLPSHATILTGLDPPRHGIRDNGTFRLTDGRWTLAEALTDAGYATAAFVGAFVLDRRYGLSQGFGVYDDEMSASRRYSGLSAGAPQRPGNLVVDACELWINAQINDEPDRPFFAWVHLFDPHTPYAPPEPYATEYQKRPYLGEIAFTDEQVGRLVGVLGERSVLDRTLIVLVGDHGEGLGEHFEDTHSRLVYEASMAVPMVWHCPSVLGSPRVVSDRVVGTVDVMPTILDLLGIESRVSMDGVSLLGSAASEDRVVYIETMAPQFQHGWSPLFGLRRHRDKFIDAPTPEYYDLIQDPGELNNLYVSKFAQARELQKLLDDKKLFFEAETEGDSSAVVAPDAAALRKLAALGYVGTSVGGAEGVGGDPKEMIKLYQRQQQAARLQTAGRFAEAVQIYREILRRTQSDGNVWEGLSLSLGQLSRVDEAVDAIMHAIELQPNDRHWIYLARLKMLQGDAVALESALEEAVRIDSEDGEIPLLRGEQALREGRTDDALRYFEEAARIDPSRQSANSHSYKGKTYAKMGDDRRAREEFLRAQFYDPTDLRTIKQLLELEERAGNYEAATEHARTIHERQPHIMRHANRLAQCYLRRNKIDEAVATLQAFAAFRPTDPAPLGNLGTLLFQAGRTSQAIEKFEEALVLSPQYAMGRVNLANALSTMEEYDLAIEQYRTVVGQTPAHALASRRLLELLTSLSRVDEAFAELERAASYGVVDWAALLEESRFGPLVVDPRFEDLRSRYTND